MWNTKQPLRRSHADRARRQIQSTWSDDERARRRQIAERRQRKLLGLLLRSPSWGDCENELAALSAG